MAQPRGGDGRAWLTGHAGRIWVFEQGGMGVLDPGIDALSILTEILPVPVHVLSARREVPANRQMPIAARMAVDGIGAAPVQDALGGEYPRRCRRMVRPVHEGRSDMDLRPMTLVADAFLMGERRITDPFHFEVAA